MAGIASKGKPKGAAPKPKPKPKGDKPKVVVRFGNLKASCWENSGEYGIWYSCKIARIFKDKEGEWQQTDHFNDSDLMSLVGLLQTTYVELAMRKGGTVHVEGEEDGEVGGEEPEGEPEGEPDVPY